MARRYINTSRYNPYSFQEMWQPAFAATQAHQQQAQAMMNLEMQNAYIGSHINPELDPEEYARYKSYEQRMQQTSKDLLERGLSSNTFNNLYGMSIDYARNIKPIEEAVANKQKYLTTLNTTLTEHPEFGVIGSLEKPLRDFRMGVPRAELANGNQIQTDVATLASAYGKSLNQLSTEEYTQLRDIVWNQTGLDWEEVQKQIATSGSPLNTIVQLTLQKHGVIDTNGNSRMNNQNDYMKMLQYANTGAYGAIGSKTPQIVQNDVQAIHSMRNQDAQLALNRMSAMQTIQQNDLQNSLMLLQAGLMSMEDFQTKYGESLPINSNDSSKNLFPDLDTKPALTPETNVITIANQKYKRSDLEKDVKTINKLTNNGHSFSEHKGIWSLFSPFTQKYLMKQMRITDPHNLTANQTRQLYNRLIEWEKATQIPPLVTYNPYKYYKKAEVERSYNAFYTDNRLRRCLVNKKDVLPLPTDVKTFYFQTNTENPNYIDIVINDTPHTIDPSMLYDPYNKYTKALKEGVQQYAQANQNIVKGRSLGIYDKESWDYALIYKQMAMQNLVTQFMDNVNAR